MPVKPISEFEQLVLLALARLDSDAYGMTVSKDIEARTGRVASLAAVYSTLGRLEKAGLVSSWISPPTQQRGGRATKHFKIERAGVLALDDAHQAMRRMRDGLDFSRELEAR